MRFGEIRGIRHASIVSALLLSLSAAVAGSQNVRGGPASDPTLVPTPAPLRADYKGVSIGMKADDVRAKLGSPKDKSDAMDQYIFSDDESAQFYYDASKTVTGMMITYSGDLSKAPTPRDIFGEDAEARPDGGVSKMVRFPKLGFWISYNKTTGDDAIVILAYQKLN